MQGDVLGVRILGPVQVGGGQVWMPIPAPKQRAVLAMLLLNVGRMVRADRLIDEVWEDRPPSQPRVAVHTYVYRLRAMLTRASIGDVALQTHGDGYVLRLPPDALDWTRWRRLVAEAQASLLDGRLESGTELMRKALSMWRGPAFADVDTPAVRAHARGMDEHRGEALEQCLAAELALGRYAAVLPELESLAAAAPHDEAMHGKLMMALYHAGRQARALAIFDRVRQRLTDDLGVDPGAELQAVHRTILRGGLKRPAVSIEPSPKTTSRVIPKQLPRDMCGFAGRRAELDLLDELVSAGTSRPATVVVVSGTAGVGKTALAVHWAYKVADRFPDGQLYVNLRGFDPGGRVVAPAEAIRGFLDALGAAPERIPADLDAQTALYRSLIAGKRVLVVLDNAYDANQVRPLLPGTSTSLVLVTSRGQLTPLAAAEGARPLPLDLLPAADARSLLAARLGADRTAAEPDAVDLIVQACARLPLALAVVAARAQQTSFPLMVVAEELAHAEQRLDALDAGDPVSQVRTVLSWSYDALTPPAARLFRLLSLRPAADISGPAAASLAAHPLTQTRRLLTELTRVNMLAEPTPGRYTYHDLLRAFAAEQALQHDSDRDRNEALTRLLDHYLHNAYTADRLLHPARDPIQLPLTPALPGVHVVCPADSNQAMSWLSDEHRTLVAALHLAASTGNDRHTWQLAWTIKTFLYWRGQWHDLVTVWASALQAAHRLDDPVAHCEAHRLFAYANTRLDRHADAEKHFRHAVDLYRQIGDTAGQARTENTLALFYEQQGNPRQALYHAQQALALYELAGHGHGQATALNTVGWYHAQLGDYKQALAYCEQSLSLLRQIDYAVGEASAWDSMGYAHRHLGQYQEAIDCYHRARALRRELGQSYKEAITCISLGDIMHTTGEHRSAIDLWNQALTILEDLGHPDVKDVRARLPFIR